MELKHQLVRIILVHQSTQTQGRRCPNIQVKHRRRSAGFLSTFSHMSEFSSSIQYQSFYVSVIQLKMSLQQETTLTIQDSWRLRPLLVALQNKKKSLKSDSAGLTPVGSCSVFEWVSVCVSVLFWRANGKTTRGERPRRLTDELTGLDALFMKKDQLGFRQDGDSTWIWHTETHCTAEYGHATRSHFAAVRISFLISPACEWLNGVSQHILLPHKPAGSGSVKETT